VALAHIEGRYESSFFKGMKDSLVNVSFMLVILAGGIQAGVTNGFSSSSSNSIRPQLRPA
jgi:hypothetical protein